MVLSLCQKTELVLSDHYQLIEKTPFDLLINYSTFVPVFCTKCRSMIGKMYKTTSRLFDSIRYYFKQNSLLF